MRALQLLLVIGNWVGSLLFGWLHFAWWLFVPPFAFFAFAFGMTAFIESYGHSIGMTSRRFGKNMLGPNITLILWNTITNCAIFAFAWIASLVLG